MHREEKPPEPTIVLPPWEDASEFIAAAIPRPPVLIHGLLHQGEKMVLGGGSKSFKTWALSHLAIALSHNLGWIGFGNSQCRVLYVNFELQRFNYQDRMKALCEALDTKIEPGRLAIWNLRGYQSSVQTLERLINERVSEEKFDVIVWDPLYKMLGIMDENSARDMAALMNALERIAYVQNAAIIFGAHFSKGNQSAKEPMDRISGSGVVAGRDPDTLFTLTEHREKFVYTASCQVRNFKPIEDFCVKWEYPIFQRDRELDPKDLKKPAGRPQKAGPDDLLRMLKLNDDRWNSEQFLEEASIKYGIAKSTFYEIVRELARSGKIFKSKLSGNWNIKAN
jgi:AAA domain